MTRSRLLIAAVLSALVGYGIDARSASASVVPTASPAAVSSTGLLRVGEGGPSANVAAFRHHGELAFVSTTTLWILDGATGAVDRVTVPGYPSDPRFSPDGRWLAFTESGPEAGNAGLARSLWLSAANGTGAVKVSAVGSLFTSFGWDPHADVLAVGALPASTHVPYLDETTVRLISPNGSSRTLVSARPIVGAEWSPNGQSLAVSTESAWSGTLATYPLHGGKPTVWLHADSGSANWIVPVGWWQKWGIGYATVGNGAVPNGDGTADGNPLFTLAAPGSPPVALGTTMAINTVGLPSANGAGDLAFVGGGDRVVWDAKHLEICRPLETSCTMAPAPGGNDSVDPVWSADGALLAFAEAPSSENPAFPSGIVEHWYDAHELWLYSPATRSFRAVPSGNGATVPVFSATGHALLYVSGDGLWLLPNITSKPIEIATPLYEKKGWGDGTYYGQIGWSGQFSWALGR